ncbi:MAG: thioesterase family protein [Ilumatobacteraceae bacterium]
MALIVVRGSGVRAAEWATRYAAAGHDVVVDDVSVIDGVRARWAAADRLGLFPGAALDRVRVDGDTRSAAVVQSTDDRIGGGETPAAALRADESTAHGCSPIHLVPLVVVDGPDCERLAAFYASLGMAPRRPTDDPEETWRLGEGLARLSEADPDTLIAIVRALRATGRGAGAAFAAHEALRFAAAAPRRWQPGEVPDAPLRLYRTPVEPDWVDYNGHMTESAYLTAAGWASDQLFRYIGDDEAYRAAGHSFYTVETHIQYVREVAVHEPIEFTTQLLGVDHKRVHFIHSMHHGTDGGLLCTVEQMLVHVDMHAGRSAPILPEVKAALDAIAAAHASLTIPTQVGSVMRLPAAAPRSTQDALPAH